MYTKLIAASLQRFTLSSGLLPQAQQEQGRQKLDSMHTFWNAGLKPYEDGYFDPCYDGLLYLFSRMHLSGKYHVIKT